MKYIGSILYFGSRVNSSYFSNSVILCIFATMHLALYSR